MRRIGIAAFVLAATACGGGTRYVDAGVEPTRAAAPAVPIRDASGQIATTEVTLAEGTAFTVLTTQAISSGTVVSGDPVALEVADNIRVGDVVVIGAGTRVRAVVSEARRAARAGQSGSLNLRVESTSAIDGQTVRLRATRQAAAPGTTGSTVALAVVVSPLFLLRRGQEIEYRAGTPLTVYTDERKVIQGWRQ